MGMDVRRIMEVTLTELEDKMYTLDIEEIQTWTRKRMIMLVRESIRMRSCILSLYGHYDCHVNLDTELGQKVHLHPNVYTSWMGYMKAHTLHESGVYLVWEIAKTTVDVKPRELWQDIITTLQGALNDKEDWPWGSND